MHITIRQEKESDYTAVYDVNSAAFGQHTEANLVNALRNNNTVFIPELSMIASVNNEIVGHILFTRIKIIHETNKFESLALAPMAVKPYFQKKGIGSLLIKSGLHKAKESGFSSVIVLGHEHYYPKFGFVPTDKWGIKPPFDVPVTVFMGIELIPGALKEVKGTVEYPKEFESV